MPNPFYQIYEGAALLAGANPGSWAMTACNEYLPDLDGVPDEVWRRCQVLFLCSPGNPTGAVASLDYLRRALELAERHDFVVASDECYSEIYLDEAQPAARACCRRRSPPATRHSSAAWSSTACRSAPACRGCARDSSPAMRRLIKPFLLYRTYHGCAMPLPTQLASIPAWNDDAHVVENRRLYRQKFAAVLPILREAMDVDAPDASFYLWPKVADDERFTRELFERKHVTVLPGSYIAREMPARESRPRSRAHFAGRQRAGMHRGGAADSRFALSRAAASHWIDGQKSSARTSQRGRPH